jgi:hypothetical protein
VLEVGTGSGYQAAVMAHLVKAVFTIEIIEPLGLQAAQRLKTMGYSNIEVPPRLGRPCAIRRHPRHGGGQQHPAAADPPARARRQFWGFKPVSAKVGS